MNRFLVILSLALCAVCAVAADYQKVVNVKDAPYNATGNGATDDTLAIQRAINAATNPADPNACHVVYFPNGDYRVTAPINLYHTNPGPDARYGTADDIVTYNLNLTMMGQGRWNDMLRAPSRITYDGVAGGTMFAVHGVAGLTIRDIVFCGDRNFDGIKMAGKVFEINSRGGHLSQGINFTRVSVDHCTTGIEWGGDGDNSPRASDATFIDLVMERCVTGFWTKAHLNVNFIFIRPIIGFVDTGFYFQKGGSVYCSLISGTNNGIGVKIDGGKNDNGDFHFDSCKLETTMWKGKRTIAFDVAGPQTVLAVRDLCTSMLDVEENGPEAGYTPAFRIGPSATVTVDTSNISSRNIAELTGPPVSPEAVPTFVQFNNCTFNYSDPRVAISRNSTVTAGYALYNCRTGAGMIPTTEKFPSQTTPEPPTGLTAATISPSQIDLNWDDVTGESGYEIMRTTTPTDAASWVVDGTTAANVAFYHSSALIPSTKYYYTVHSKAGARSSFESNVAWSTTASQGMPINGLKLWLKADAGITKDVDDLVSAWLDQSGNGYSLTQVADNNKPYWVDDQLNGLPVVRFSNSDPYQWLQLSGQSWDMKNYSVFVVMKPADSVNNNQQLGAFGGWGQFCFSAAANGGIYAGNTGDTIPPGRLTPLELNNHAMSTGSWQLYSMTNSAIGPTFATGNFSFYKGGALLAASEIKSPAANWTGFILGENGPNSLNGEVAEVIVYDRALNDADRVSAESYLKEKYGLLQNSAPTVSLTSPADGSRYIQPANVLMQANAEDIDGKIIKVEFNVDGVKVGQDTTAPFAFTWANTTLGAHTLTATATDNNGAATTSDPVSIMVKQAGAQPDLAIRIGSGILIGTGVYSADGTGQTVSQTLRTGQTVAYYFTLANRGSLADKFLIRGPAGDANWTVKYFTTGNVEITGAVTTIGWYTTNIAPGGSYTMRVEVTPGMGAAGGARKDVLISASSFLDSELLDVVKATTTKQPLTSVVLSANPGVGQGVGMPITLTAAPTGGQNIEYQFSVTDPASQTTVIRPYAAAASFDWTPVLVGNHQVTVWAREVGDPAPFNAAAVITYNVLEGPLQGVSVAAEIQADKSWRFTATPIGGVNVQYRFCVSSGSVWSQVLPYGANNICNWRPAKAGNYTVRAYAKETRNGRTVEKYADQAIRVTTIPPPPAKLTAVRLAATPASPRPINTPITLTATPVGGTNIEYRFRLLNGSTWTDLQAYGPSNTIVWVPVAKKTYTITVYAHEIGSSTTTQVMTSITYVVQ